MENKKWSTWRLQLYWQGYITHRNGVFFSIDVNKQFWQSKIFSTQRKKDCYSNDQLSQKYSSSVIIIEKLVL